MRTLFFATGNPHKFEEAKRALAARGAAPMLRRLDVAIPETQSDDVSDVLAGKVAFVRKITALPFVVDDMSCRLDGTNGFPGTLTKSVLDGLGAEGIARSFPEGLGITIGASVALSYLGETRVFEGVVRGVIRRPAAPQASAMALGSMVWLPDQGKFLDDPSATTHRTLAFDALAAFIADAERAASDARDRTAERWSGRAAAWGGFIASPDAYVNYQDGYARFDALLDRIMKTVERPRCLDVGCGTGVVARTLVGSGAASVTAIDISAGMVAEASTSAPDIRFQVGRMEDVREGPFDVIASRGVVISHLSEFEVIPHLEAMTALAHEGTYAVFDFIGRIDDGGFENVGPKARVSADAVTAIMRDLGWVPVAKDGDGTRVTVMAFHRPFPDSKYFVTGNPQKLLELRAAADMPHLHPCMIDLPELKHDDIVRIACEKARLAHAFVGRTVACTDGGIFFDAYDGFPGPNSKQAATKLGPQGLLRLLAGTAVRTGKRRNAAAVFDGATMRTETAETPIVVSEAPRGAYPSYPMDAILIPAHADNPQRRTYAEMAPEARVPFTELPALAAFLKRACA